MTTYHLGPVKPYVEKAANILGPKFGIRDIGGYRDHGSVPGSDHPLGKALDMMTNSKAVGDKLAEYAVANYRALGIKYVIWWRRIWTPQKGWHDYHGPSDHTDHVHLSFNDTSGSFKGLPDVGDITSAIGSAASGLVPDGIQEGIRNVAEQLRAIGAGVTKVGKVADLIASAFLPNNLVRSASAVAGTIFILIGIFFLSREARK